MLGREVGIRFDAPCFEDLCALVKHRVMAATPQFSAYS